jgi:hypothetical protein
MNVVAVGGSCRRHATPLVSVLPSTSIGHTPSTRVASAAACSGNRPPDENAARQPAPAARCPMRFNSAGLETSA